MSDETNEYVEVVDAGGIALVFFPTPDGGRIIPAKQIKSIVPDFKGVGSMVFLTGGDKAIKVPQTPQEITNDIIDNEPETTQAG